MYADKITRSMQETIDETTRRREKQLQYNEKHGITPTRIIRSSGSVLKEFRKQGVESKAYIEPSKPDIAADPVVKYMSAEALEKAIKKSRKAMEKSASELDFMQAARYRDEIAGMEELLRKKR
jgi:excinuclease ABC subunit B